MFEVGEGAVPVIAPVAVAREYPDGKLPLVTAYSIVSLPSVAVDPALAMASRAMAVRAAAPQLPAPSVAAHRASWRPASISIAAPTPSEALITARQRRGRQRAGAASSPRVLFALCRPGFLAPGLPPPAMPQ